MNLKLLLKFHKLQLDWKPRTLILEINKKKPIPKCKIQIVSQTLMDPTFLMRSSLFSTTGKVHETNTKKSKTPLSYVVPRALLNSVPN